MQANGQSFDIIVPPQPVIRNFAAEPEQSFEVPPTPETPEIPEPSPEPAPYGPESPHPAERPKHHRMLNWKVAAVAGSCLLLLVGGGTWYAYHTTKGLSQVYLGSQQIKPSTSTAALLSQLTNAQKAYRFTIAYPDKTTKNFAMTDAGISIDGKGSLAKTEASLRHSGWRKFVWWRPMRYTLVTKTDSQKLDDFIKTSAQAADKPAVDAALTIQDGNPLITDAANGYGYTIPGGKAYLLQNIERLKTAQLSLKPQTIQPDIQAKDLAKAQTKVQAYTARQVTFTIDTAQVTASKADIAGWLDISPVPSAHTADVTINSGKVQAYIDKLSAKYVKPPVSEIQTTDAAGVTSVLIPGQDGIDVTNKDAAVKAAVTAMDVNQPSAISLTVNHVAHSTVNAGDYDKWIVVDLTTKRMYAYEHTNLVRSFLVSAGAPKTPTVVGEYHIYSKYVSKDMRGSNADGSRYFQPHVHYVNFFYKDYAIHGNYWRPASYFGNINSSHGCVGITDSDAQWLYSWAPIGTTVITHN